MPIYKYLKAFQRLDNPSWQIPLYKNPLKKLQFIVNHIINLKKGLKASIPEKTISQNLLIATWNLREFDSNGKRQGPRLEECFYYIAEIINAFDIVALQEIKEDLKPLQKIMKILGHSWDYFVTDITVGPSGAGERMAFVYDTSKVFFTNMTGQIVLPESKGSKVKQFARTPFFVSFQAGWLKLNLCTVHIYFGSGKSIDRRLKELSDISTFFERRIQKTRENYILLGDFNVVSQSHKTMDALLQGNFAIPPQLDKNKKGSNLDRTKFYDQILYNKKSRDVKLKDAGVFDYYQYVFREDENTNYKLDYNMLRKFNGKKSVRKLTPGVFKAWKTFQMSDHLPLWANFKIDFSEGYLRYLKVDPKYLKKNK